ncbi:hypothetical protein GCM10009422_23990 [Brevundimonas kwangchunensis]|uniref:Uncharacterized protein n=1 Tax=Brevundimonas kwangchunensis TaxID=322163 RepID=A0ABN1H262_9CAUL
MCRQTIGEALAARLYAAESAIDQALSHAAGLVAALPGARADAFLSAVAGQAVFDGAAASVQSLTDVRAHLVRTHTALAALARKLGLEPLAVGPIDKPGDTPPVGGRVIHATGELVNEDSREMANNSLPGKLNV